MTNKNSKYHLINTKTPHRFLDEEFVLNIEFYFNISPASDTLCWGDGIDIFLCILDCQSEFSELSITYFLPSAIAACVATSLAIKTVLKLSLTVRLTGSFFFYQLTVTFKPSTVYVASPFSSLSTAFVNALSISAFGKSIE